MSYRGCAGPKGSYTPVKGSKIQSLQNSVSPDLLKFLHSQPTRKGVCCHQDTDALTCANSNLLESGTKREILEIRVLGQIDEYKHSPKDSNICQTTYMKYLEESKSIRHKIEMMAASWRGNGEFIAQNFIVLYDEKVMEMDGSDGCTKLCIY